jgi:hypothetical protein
MKEKPVIAAQFFKNKIRDTIIISKHGKRSNKFKNKSKYTKYFQIYYKIVFII